MKSPSSILIVAALAVFAPQPDARAQSSPFRVRVEQVNKSESEKFTKKQTRSLKIFVSNSSKEAAELRAKYVFFGRTAKGHDVVKLDEGEKPVSVGSLATAMVESGIVTATFEEEHPASNSSGKGSKTAGGGRKVEASGEKITGFGVQVFQGEKMVAEYYDPPSGKEEWTKAYPAKLPTAPAKAKK